MSDTTEPAIIVKDVTKSFRIPLDKVSGIKQIIVNVFKRKKGYREFNALNGVSFEIKKGEFFGIVGRNGSGKSTLLKILAGVYTPDSGGVAVNGSLTPFIELGVGFNPELSGRENVFLNGALLGFSRKEMEEMYDEIVDFAELHDFMEERLKNYSSGMQVRLAFSIAIRADTDILVLDEVLAVGDSAFQKKCYSYFKELKNRNKTVILVTHAMDNVTRFCDRALLLGDGVVQDIGSPNDISYEYEMMMSSTESTESVHANRRGTQEVTIGDISINEGRPLKFRGDYRMNVAYRNTSPDSKRIHFSLGVYHDGLKCFDISTYYTESIEVPGHEQGQITVDFTDFRLLPGSYSCNVSIFNEDMDTVYDGINDAYELNVLGTPQEVAATGVVATDSRIYKGKEL